MDLSLIVYTETLKRVRYEMIAIELQDVRFEAFGRLPDGEMAYVPNGIMAHSI